MKRLYLLRHAKAVREPSSDDFARALALRGRRDAATLGRFLERQRWLPDVIVASPSQRTSETVQRLTAGWRREVPSQEDASLYLAPSGRILDRIRSLDNAAESAMIVGHNPGMEELAVALADDGPEDAQKRLHEKYPTCALAVFDLSTERWAEADRAEVRFVDFIRPKDLGES